MNSQIKKLYRTSHKYEKHEILFLFGSLLILMSVTGFYSINYFISRKYFFAMTEVLTLIIAGASLYFLIRGNKEKSTTLLFPIFGNLYLLRIIILYAYFDFERFPFSIEIFYCFQIIIILAVAYFSKKKFYLFITLLIGLINNAVYLVNFSDDLVEASIMSTLTFLILPFFFGLHMMYNNQLLENFYINNLNKNREINHRLKNHLALLSSLIELKALDTAKSVDVYKDEISAAVSSFSTIYDKLLYSEDVHHLNLYEYFKSILNEYSKNFSITSKLSFTDKSLNADSNKAANLGMILTELITNSIKHTNINAIEICLSVEIKENTLSIIFTDNGELSKSFQKKSEISFGETIISSIVSETFHGEYHISDTGKYTSMITLPIQALT